ncbi:MAG: 2-dehydropantoate 2-reductase [Candidatus Cybelea sp.]|jgi:2-dehydropantoate 2-reductase
MKIGIMGAGGLGGYIGARLAQAGHGVAFIARGAHLAAIRENGLRVISELGDAHLAHVTATSDPATVGYVDCIIVAVKLWDTEAAVDRARPMIGQSTTIVSFQNGIEKDEVLARMVGSEHVIGGVSYMAVKIARPGVIEQTGRMARAILGELNGARTHRVTSLAQMLTNAGIDTQVNDDIIRATWEKFVFLVGVAGTTSLLRSDIGQIRENADARSLLGETMLEAVAVGLAAGVNLDPEFAQAQLDYCDTLPARMRASMAVDLEHARRLELPWLNGAVVRLAAELGVDAPVNGVIARALSIYTNGTNT